jgi:hypothetical protein
MSQGSSYYYAAAKARAAFRASWMGAFQDHCSRLDPRTIGRIKWDEIEHSYNIGTTPEDAAKAYIKTLDTSYQSA